MVWVAIVSAAACLAAAAWLVPAVLFVLDERKHAVDGGDNPWSVLVRDLPDRIGVAVLLAGGLVAAYAFSYRPPPPEGAQADQSFEVVVGCALDVRRRMPTVLEQLQAHAACYGITLLASIAPKCQPVPADEPEQRQRDADRACRAQVTERGIYGLLLFALGFALGSAPRR